MNNTSGDRSPVSHFLGLAPFLRLSLAGQDLMPLAQTIYKQLEEDSANPDLLMNLSMIMQILNDPALALQIQQQALLLKRTYHIPAVVQPAKHRILLLMAPGDVSENTPLDCLMEGEAVELIFYYLDEQAPWFVEPIPEHDILMVGVCESESHRPILEMLEARLKDWDKPVINLPQSIAHTERAAASVLLHDAPGIEMPKTFLIAKSALEAVAAQKIPLTDVFEQTRFPIIVRPRDSHAGHDLEKIASYAALTAYLSKVESDEFFVANFIDYSDAQGDFGKLRVVLIEGEAFIAHKAISKHWMIHYLNAGMMEDQAKQQAEADAMQHFDDFIARHKAALQAVYEATKLDYLGIDCAETQDGKLLIFEIDHVMVVHGMDPVDQFPYKQAPIQKIRDAFNRMIEGKIHSFVPIQD